MIRSVCRHALIALASTTTLLVVSGCQSAPDPLIITVPPVSADMNYTVTRLSVSDARPHRYLYRRLSSDDKASFVAPREPLTTTIEQALQPLVARSNSESLQWQVSVTEAAVEAEISALKYKLTHQLQIRVQAVKDNRRYTNTYRGRAQSEALGRPDAAVIEREFSQLLSQVLEDISRDPELRLIN